jgi:hypothetical protein
MTCAHGSILSPKVDELTENERAWIGFLRLITRDTDPSPTLARVQAMRCVFQTITHPTEIKVWKALG